MKTTPTEVLLRISGKTYDAAIGASQVPSEEQWPEPAVRHVGAGRSYLYNVTEGTAHLIVWHLEDIADSLGGSSDEDAQRDRQAIIRDLDRARRILRGAK